MRPIDRFLSTLWRGEGEELILQTGGPIRLRQGSQQRVLLAQPVRADQIQAILSDIVPPHIENGFTQDGDAAFDYETESGVVKVMLRRFQGRVDAVIRLGTPAPPMRVNPPSITPPSQKAPPPAQPAAAPPTRAAPPASQPVAPSRAQPTTQVSSNPFHGLAPSELGQRGAPPATYAPTPPPEPPPPAPAPPLPAPFASPPAAAEAPALQVLSTSTQPSSGRKQIDPLLHALVGLKASDLHLTANLQPRMRKDGDIGLLPGFAETLSSDTVRSMLMEVAPQVARERFEKTNDTDFAYEIPGLARFRVNAFKDRRGTGGVLRVIPSKILTAEELKLPQVVKDLCTLHKGLVVVTGPTGSGKSTTLAAMVDWINKNRNDHIITIEDPVEFVHETRNCLVNQREVHADTASFSAALRAALREDPDIVLVGEMRDLETISIAIETAETGHLVFGTLHTTTAVSTVDRIIDQFPTDRQQQVRVMLSESLRGVIAQTLCKKKGGGRVAALEILVGSNAVSNLIREGKTFQIPSLMQTQKAAGMQTLNDSLFQLVKDGLVEPEDAFSKSVDRTSFKMMLERAGIKLEGH